jgi:hypothetical protein
MYLIRLKSEFDGVTITRPVAGLGQVTFSPSVKEEFYDNYLKLGFDIFEVYNTETKEFETDISKLRFTKFNGID